MISDHKYYLIDLGSSTIKLYVAKDQICYLIDRESLWLRDFLGESGISQEGLNKLFSYFDKIKTKYSLTNANTKIYATGIFRKIPDKKKFIEEFFFKTGLYIYILSHELEAFYLDKIREKVQEKLNRDMLVINIGNDTTEIISCFSNKKTVVYKLEDIGVGTITTRFQLKKSIISDLRYDEILSKMIQLVKNEIDVPESRFEYALYTGGELSFMNILCYPLQKNEVFGDLTHPAIISIADYKSRNEKLFHKNSLEELEKLMPDNPKWMHGARACSLIANAICSVFGVEYIIPSDSNLVDGVIIQETRSIAICGSFNRFLEQIEDLKREFERNNISVLSPRNTEVIGKDGDFVVFREDIIKNHNTWDIERLHLDAIDNCDCVVVCNHDNHIGVSTTFELKYAYEKGKRIVFVDDNESAHSFKDRWGLSVFPCEIGIL